MRQSTAVVFSLILVCVAGMLAPVAHAGDEESVTISRELEFAESSAVSADVEAQCMLQTRLPQFIKDYAKRTKVVLAEDVSASDGGRVLQIEIINVIGRGGGAWSGSKSVTVRGELTDDGEVIGSFLSSRFSGGGAFGAYKGTCSILGRCIKAMGSDIAKWLANPTMDARLGDA